MTIRLRIVEKVTTKCWVGRIVRLGDTGGCFIQFKSAVNTLAATTVGRPNMFNGKKFTTLRTAKGSNAVICNRNQRHPYSDKNDDRR